MSKINLNLNDYKSSGVYFLEQDNSIINSADVNSSRLAVGFSKKGPFNVPVYISNNSDLTQVYGDVDAKLERKGVFFNRSIQTLLRSTPVFALNLLPVSKGEKVDVVKFGYKPSKVNETLRCDYIDIFDKSRFWKPSVEYLDNLCTDVDGNPNPLNATNTGTDDFTLVVRKAENINGYNVTARDWFGSDDKIPYTWVKPSDYISDYFVQVISISGDWTSADLSTDIFWKQYFQLNGTTSVLKADKLNKFLKLDGVSVIGNYTGCLLPDFYDKTGALQSIAPIVNQYTTKTGLMISVDNNALEDTDVTIDMVGHSATPDSFCKFLSYDFQYVDGTDIKQFDIFEESTGGDASANVTDNVITFSKDCSIFRELSVGALVSDVNGNLTRIIKKQMVSNALEPDVYGRITTITSLPSSGQIRLCASITSIYKTLTPILVKGYDIETKTKTIFDTTYLQKDGYSYVGEDAPVAMIYGMLYDDGILRGLKNPDMIDFRYIIDTMAHGLGPECGSKKYLAKLAKDRSKCTAIINAPSITEFTNTNLAAFYDVDSDYKTFDSKYIKTGGNDDAIKNVEFSLPTEENGSKYCGVFSPFLKYISGSKTILVPPAADVANSYMKKYQGGDPYVTIANTNGLLSNGNVTGLEYQFDQEDQDVLEPLGINPILYKNGRAMIYGDRTAYQDVKSDFNYLHVREILNTIEIECNAVLQNYVFKYNNAATRADVIQRINPILKGMKDAGALYDYELQMDENNNTDDLVDRSFAIIDIGVWITKNMEKIVTKISVNKLSN